MQSLDAPAGATLLCSEKQPPNAFQKLSKMTVPVPNSSPPPPKQNPSILSSIASPTLSTIPQLLLSTSLPSMAQSSASGSSATASTSSSSLVTTMSGFTYNPRAKSDQTPLMSSKDPLSLPIMTNNFKRFVTVVGPVFWLQDRVEEIVLWKRGTAWTCIWMLGYTLLCIYPRLFFLLPHCFFIGTILATYPFPSNPTVDPLYSTVASVSPPTSVESTVAWQTNIQAIQNLMGTYADFYSIIEPYIQYFCLTPAHFSTSPQFPTTSSSPTSPSQPTFHISHSPYTTQILAVLVLSFFPWLFVIHLPWFPVRTLCVLAGLMPILFLHPYAQAVAPALRSLLLQLFIKKARPFVDRVSCFFPYLSSAGTQMSHLELGGEENMDKGLFSTGSEAFLTTFERLIDDDRLSDMCWNSEMREVELWENERYSGPPLDNLSSSTLPSTVASIRKGWSKQNLRSGERAPWTRSRDGSNNVGAGIESSGEVSSNLTFSLAHGWSFVGSEDWRKDPLSTWAECGCDEDGWVYTNDAWLSYQPSPYTTGGGHVTRRRRWVRRVWYNQNMITE